jgi:SAM-dependent methyltransferase
MPHRSFSRFELYELCVQKPAVLAPLLRAIHGRNPTILAEDFCGTAALARHWLGSVPRSRAIATDLDPEPLAYAKLSDPRLKTLKLIRADVTKNPAPTKHPKPSRNSHNPDLIFVGNFSIGEIHNRKTLLRYLKACRASLAPHGTFVCDTYGGESAFRTGSVQRIHDVPRSRLRVRYTWQQRTADPITGCVENALHFRIDDRGEIIQELTDAFVYRWRLWSLPELRDAMLEAGFAQVDIYNQVPDAQDSEGNLYIQPITDPDELDDSYIVCVAGRA